MIQPFLSVLNLGLPVCVFPTIDQRSLILNRLPKIKLSSDCNLKIYKKFNLRNFSIRIRFKMIFKYGLKKKINIFSNDSKEIEDLRKKLNAEIHDSKEYKDCLVISKTRITQLETELFDIKSAKSHVID